jgi:hypothetical protein
MSSRNVHSAYSDPTSPIASCRRPNRNTPRAHVDLNAVNEDNTYPLPFSPSRVSVSVKRSLSYFAEEEVIIDEEESSTWSTLKDSLFSPVLKFFGGEEDGQPLPACGESDGSTEKNIPEPESEVETSSSKQFNITFVNHTHTVYDMHMCFVFTCII